MRFLKDPLNWFSLLLLLLALVPHVALPLHAQPAVPTGTTAAGEAVKDIVCIEEIAEPAATLTQDMLEFLNTHYQSDQANSQLAAGSMEKYEEYRTNMFALLAAFKAAQSHQLITKEFTERQICLDYLHEQIRSVERQMLDFNLENSGAKRTHRLVSKLKDVNGKMRELNRDFGEMYGAFKAFVDKLQNTVQ